MAHSIHSRMDGVLRKVAPDRSDALIPSPSVQNHAASLSLLPDGKLACVWFGGTMEGMPDISIHMSTPDKGSGNWSEATVLQDNPTRSEQNPLLFNALDGKLWILYTSQISGNQETAVVRRRVSEDSGKSFGPPDTLIDAPGTFIRQPIVTCASGDLLLHIFKCRTASGEAWSGNRDVSGLYRSSDGGRSWAFTEVPGSLGCVHMNIIPRGGDRMIAFFRSRWADFIHVSNSADDGESWSPPQPTSLPNNNSSIQCARLSDGRLAMVYNHSSAANATARRLSLYDELGDHAGGETSESEGRQTFWGAPRAPLSLAFSSDDGAAWSEPHVVDTSDGYCLSNNSANWVNRELSYLVLCETEPSKLDIAFT